MEYSLINLKDHARQQGSRKYSVRSYREGLWHNSERTPSVLNNLLTDFVKIKLSSNYQELVMIIRLLLSELESQHSFLAKAPLLAFQPQNVLKEVAKGLTISCLS